MEKIDYARYFDDIALLAQKIRNVKDRWYTGLYPIPRGGYLPAIQLSKILNIPIVTEVKDEKTLIVDDIVDSGKTLSEYPNNDSAVVYAKDHSKDKTTYFGAIQNGWILIPDEKDCGIEDHIRRIFEYIGEDPNRVGLQGTPDRVRRMFQEIYRGYDPTKAPKITTFPNGTDGITYDNMVIDHGDFYSQCEHHMKDFFGKYWFAYIPAPKGRILGISKIGRVVDYCSARLQVQERLTHDIVAMLKEALMKDGAPEPLGIALVMKGRHMCKESRGARKKGIMTTTIIEGAFRDDPIVREEFMHQVGSVTDV